MGRSLAEMPQQFLQALRAATLQREGYGAGGKSAAIKANAAVNDYIAGVSSLATSSLRWVKVFDC